jgi:hypothetical protein
MIMARRRVPLGRANIAIPRIAKPPCNNHRLQLTGWEVVSIKPAYLNSLPSITGFIEITPLSDKVTELPAGTANGAGKVNVVVAVGGVTVADWPPPLRVIELNKVGWLTVIVAEEMLSLTARSLWIVNVPAATVDPGWPTLFTDVLLTSAPGVGAAVGLGSVVPNTLVGVAFGVVVRDGVGLSGVRVGLGLAVAVRDGVGLSAVRVGLGLAVGARVAVGFAVGVRVGVGFAVDVRVGVGFAVGARVGVGFGVGVVIGAGVIVGLGVGVAVGVLIGVVVGFNTMLMPVQSRPLRIGVLSGIGMICTVCGSVAPIGTWGLSETKW